jgi:plasmid stabilization system protein ParE
MRVSWNRKALFDLERVHALLESRSTALASRTVQMLASAPDQLLTYPGMGERLEGFEPDEVRRLLVGGYELRYQVDGELIRVLRIWHELEDR